MGRRTILLVEDEAAIVEVVARYLERDGYRVVVSADGDRAVEEFRRLRPDLVLLDVMLPGQDGWEVCRRIRGLAPTPIIMLTARDEEADKLTGLALGADDYITKPFSPREVVARVRAVLRRSGGAEAVPGEAVRVHDLEIDPGRVDAFRAGRPLGLTPTEFKLLYTLARQPGRVFTRLQLLDLVQGYAFEGYERTVDAHVKNLRAKLELDPRHPRYVVTAHRVGYRLSEDGRG